MIGLAILAAVCLYAGIWYLVVRALPKVWPKIVAVLIAVYVPFWDAPVGFYTFTKSCEESAGLKIFEAIQPQKSVFLDARSLGSAGWILSRGLKFIELQHSDTRVQRINASDPERQEFINGGSVISQFGYKSKYSNDSRDTRINRFQSEIFRLKSGNVVAQYTEFSWFLWIQGLATPILGRGWRCPEGGGEDAIVDFLVRGVRHQAGRNDRK
jgi:hypothetical protein